MTGAAKGHFVPHQYRILADKLACARHWLSAWNVQCLASPLGKPYLLLHFAAIVLVEVFQQACHGSRTLCQHPASTTKPRNARGTAHLKPLLFLLLVGRGITATRLDAGCGGARRRLAAVFHPTDHLEKLVEVDLAVLIMSNFFRGTTPLAHEFRTPFLSTCSKMWTKLPTSPPSSLRGGLLAAHYGVRLTNVITLAR